MRCQDRRLITHPDDLVLQSFYAIKFVTSSGVIHEVKCAFYGMRVVRRELELLVGWRGRTAKISWRFIVRIEAL